MEDIELSIVYSACPIDVAEEKIREEYGDIELYHVYYPIDGLHTWYLSPEWSDGDDDVASMGNAMLIIKEFGSND